MYAFAPFFQILLLNNLSCSNVGCTECMSVMGDLMKQLAFFNL